MGPQELLSRLENVAEGPQAFGPDAGPGLYLGVPSEQYHAHPGVSRSILAEVARQSPIHGLHKMREDDDESSDSMDLGEALHRAVLEPEVYDELYDVAPEECEATKASDGEPCTNAAKERYGGFWTCGVHAPDQEPDEIEVLKKKHAHAVSGMRTALRGDPDAAPLLWELPGLNEATILYRNPETGLTCKARPDRIVLLPDGKVSIVDVKTTKSAHPRDFRRKAARLGYWLQPAHYGSAVESLSNPLVTGQLEVVDFVFTVVESSRPYAVQCYRPSPDDRAAARKRQLSLLRELQQAIEGDPHAYRSGVATMHLKGYEKERLGIIE